MCGGFTCSKNSLLALNIIYVIVAFILIGVAAAANAASIVTSLPLVSGIVTCGVFLLIISIVGLVGATKHHQVMLFFYMIILFIIFIIQFSVACALLALNADQQQLLAHEGWHLADNSTRSDAQNFFGCCGFETHVNNVTTGMGHPSCYNVKDHVSGDFCCDHNAVNATECCWGDEGCGCKTCRASIEGAMDYNVVGVVGLLFSFTEFLGVWLTVRYRNQRDPRANPSAFL